MFVNGLEELKFKAKDTEIDRNILCLGNISPDFSIANMEKTSLYSNVYDFSVDYWTHNTGKARHIHRNLMKKSGIV